ncbi:MAG: BamA/TamA family outer membrane protein [Gemmatimonadetes bacterium]|nr:BamA/TamA family outer membrane protein [Gemmatimonadota bacterium]
MLWAWVVTTLVSAGPLPAQEVAEPERPRIGLVLSGGGARGAAHVGVLQVLEDLRVPVHAVVGTSMGAIVGGLYASGLSADRLERELLALDWAAIFRDDVPRQSVSFRRKEEQRQVLLDQEFGVDLDGIELPNGLVAGHRLGLLLETLLLPVLEEDDFDRLPIPFRATATDLGTGELVVLADGHLPRAIRASMAVPAAFTPVERRGRLLVDGGLVRNLPLDLVEAFDLDVVIAVDVISDLQPPDSLESLVGVTRQVIRLMTRETTRRALAGHQPAVLIQPDLASFSSVDFPLSEAMIRQGEAAAREHAEALRRWSLPEPEYAAWQRTVRDRRGSAAVPDYVRVEGPDPEVSRRLETRLRVRAGEPIDTVLLRQDLDRIYGLGGYDRVGFELESGPEGVGLVVRPEPQAIGPTTARVGLELTDDLAGRGTFTIGARLVRLDFTPAGGELRVTGRLGEDRGLAVELYQPLAAGSPLFTELGIAHIRRAPRFALPGTGEAYSDRRTRAAGGFGLHIGTWGEATVGMAYERIRAEPETGAEVPTFDGWQGALEGRIAVDRLDDAAFPRHGVLARAALTSVRADLGDGPAHDRASGDVTLVTSRGRTTLMLGAAGGARLAGSLPFHEAFRLGGFLRLSGLPPDALAGEEMAFGRVLLLRTVGAARIVRVGVGVEAGDAWPAAEDPTLERLRPSGVALLGIRTLFGTAYLGLGWSEGGHWAGHLFLGPPPY